MKTITILATGSRGDVQPFVALAYALVQAGRQVRVVSNHIYETWIRSYGLEISPLHWDPRENIRLQVQLGSEKNPLVFIRHQAENSRAVFELLQQGCWQACQDAEALIFSVLVPGGDSIAEKLGIPCLAGALHPLEPTHAFPNQFILQDLGGKLNWASHKLAEQLFQLAVGRFVNQFRASQGLSLIRFPRTFFGQLREKGIPLLCNLSPTIIPHPADWPERVQMHGYWFLPSPPGWQPQRELVDFIAQGEPPVYLGFGSMVTGNPAETSKMAVEALHRCGRRAILSKGWGALKETVLDLAQILLIDEVPHDWLFERMAAIVHHGGAGTTASALRAGVLQVIVPHMQDQPYWGQKMHRLGVAPQPLSRARLNVDEFAHAIQQAVNDQTLQQRARTVGEQIRAEQGLEKTVQFVTQYFG